MPTSWPEASKPSMTFGAALTAGFGANAAFATGFTDGFGAVETVTHVNKWSVLRFN